MKGREDNNVQRLVEVEVTKEIKNRLEKLPGDTFEERVTILLDSFETRQSIN